MNEENNDSILESKKESRKPHRYWKSLAESLVDLPAGETPLVLESVKEGIALRHWTNKVGVKITCLKVGENSFKVIKKATQTQLPFQKEEVVNE